MRVACRAGTSAEDHAGEQREREREQRDRPVDAQCAARAAGRGSRAEASGTRPPTMASSRPASAADAGQHEALDDQLPDDPRAAGAERDAHRDFLLAADRAREQQVGDIGARDQQHQRDGAEQHQQRGPDVLHQLVLRAA